MKIANLALLMVATITAAFAETDNFDSAQSVRRLQIGPAASRAVARQSGRLRQTRRRRASRTCSSNPAEELFHGA